MDVPSIKFGAVTIDCARHQVHNMIHFYTRLLGMTLETEEDYAFPYLQGDGFGITLQPGDDYLPPPGPPTSAASSCMSITRSRTCPLRWLMRNPSGQPNRRSSTATAGMCCWTPPGTPSACAWWETDRAGSEQSTEGMEGAPQGSLLFSSYFLCEGVDTMS